MSKLALDRTILSGITKNHQAIKALEEVFTSVDETLPRGIEEATQQAIQAITLANSVLAALVEIAAGLDLVAAAPVPDPIIAADDLTPPVPPLPAPDDLVPQGHLGTMSTQDHDAVDITGGTVGLNAGTVGEPSFYLVDRSTGLYRTALNSWGMTIAGVNIITYTGAEVLFKQNVKSEKQLISTVPIGTAPLQVISTTKVANLHVERATQADNLGTAGAYPADATDIASNNTLTNFIKNRLISKGV